MSLIYRENVLTAQLMYLKRIEFLRSEVSRLVNKGEQLGQSSETEIMSALDEIENELEGIDECLELLKNLLRGTR